MIDDKPNLFRQLSAWFASSTEDFFTASLAAMLYRNEPFRRQFLQWLSPYVGESEDWVSREWNIAAQVSKPSCRGEALLDMVFTSPDLELWFEHKTGAGLGQYDDLDQLEKYLDAANRVMLDVRDGFSDVQWPAHPLEGRPRIILFYITKKAKTVDGNRYGDRLYRPDSPFGLAFPPNGHLRWRDLWPVASSVLGNEANHTSGFEQRLADEFLSYWQAMPGMWKVEAVGDWEDLLLPHTELPKDQPCPFDDLWTGVLDYSRQTLKVTGTRHWRGYEQQVFFANHALGDIDNIFVTPVVQVADQENWNKSLGNQVLRLLFRRREGADWGPVEFADGMVDTPIRARITRLNGEERIEVLAGITDWSEACDVNARRAAIQKAFAEAVELVSNTLESRS